VTGIVIWIVRVLIILLIVRLIVRFVSAHVAKPQRRRAVPERAGGTLVRDPHCGTYVPEARAVTTGSGSTTLQFCSEECRDAYLSVRERRPRRKA